MSVSSSRTWGSARPQYGHSKSPYSTTVTGASSGPRMWSDSGSTVNSRSRSGFAPTSRAAIRRRCERSPMVRNTSHVRAAAPTGAARMPALASSSGAPSKASVATNRETVKPTPALAPAPATAPQPAVGRSRPCDSRVTSSARADDAERLAGHIADENAERDRRARGPLQEGAVDREARLRQREQRDDYVARPRVIDELQTLVGGDRGPDALAGHVLELGRGLLAELAEALSCLLEVRAGRGRGPCQEPKREPTTSGSMPDSSATTHIALPSTKYGGPRRSLSPSSSTSATANRPAAQIRRMTSIESL